MAFMADLAELNCARMQKRIELLDSDLAYYKAEKVANQAGVAASIAEIYQATQDRTALASKLADAERARDMNKARPMANSGPSPAGADVTPAEDQEAVVEVAWSRSPSPAPSRRHWP